MEGGIQSLIMHRVSASSIGAASSSRERLISGGGRENTIVTGGGSSIADASGYSEFTSRARRSPTPNHGTQLK